MRALACVIFVLLGPAGLLADGRTELEILRARCSEQERQIRALESEIEALHSQIALERRRARGAETVADKAVTTPAPKAAPQTYTVKSGDTVSSIARRFKTSTATLMKENGISDPTRLKVGEKLTLPSPAAAPAPAPATMVAEKSPAPAPKEKNASPTPPKAAEKSPTYTVKSGDTLYGVARKHELSISQLQKLNPKINPNKLLVGQNLVVTGTAPAPQAAPRTQTISTAPTPVPVKKPAPAPAPAEKTPAPEPIVEQPAPAPVPSQISSIIVMEEVSFGDFAEKHGTTTEQLNALNGLNLKGDLTLAKGSELYVPGR